MPADMKAHADDVAAETVVLRQLVAGLDERAWRQATPAPGWSIADQVSHLAHFDEAATESAPPGRGSSARGLARLRPPPAVSTLTPSPSSTGRSPRPRCLSGSTRPGPGC